MNKFIYVRNSPDWRRIKTTEDFIAANQNARPLMKEWLPAITEAIETWNRSFGVSYFKFRSQLKDIASANLAKIGAKIINKSDLSPLNSGDFLLYVIDDDDWAAPWLFDEVAKRCRPEDNIIVWPFGYYGDKEWPFSATLNNTINIYNMAEPIHDIQWVYSNNAVLTRKGYRFCQSKGSDFLEDHREADAYARLCGVRKIEKVLSVYNQSPASATKLWWFTKKCRSGIHEIIKGYEKSPPVPPELTWAEPYVRLLCEKIRKLSTPNKVFE